MSDARAPQLRVKWGPLSSTPSPRRAVYVLNDAPTERIVSLVMRADMSKVIVERPRRGRRYARLRAAPRELEDAPRRESIRHRWKSRLCLNENLAPLRRYLGRQVGKPWAKVYSDICANLRVDSTVQQHVRDHLEDFVAIKAYVEDGEIWVASRWGAPQKLAQSYRRFYVCPTTGLLRKAKERARFGRLSRKKIEERDRARKQRMREVSPSVQLHRLDGHWYEVELAEIGDETPRRYDGPIRSYPYLGHDRFKERDVVMSNGQWTGDRGDLYGRWGVYAVAKRQLSKREKKRFGLN